MAKLGTEWVAPAWHLLSVSTTGVSIQAQSAGWPVNMGQGFLCPLISVALRGWCGDPPVVLMPKGRSWGDGGSFRKVLAVQAGGPEFNPQNPHKAKQANKNFCVVVVRACNPSPGRAADTGGSLQFAEREATGE